MKTIIASQDSNLKLRSLLENPASSIEEICRLLTDNPTISAYILRVVNNPLFGFEGSVNDISRAIALIGKGQINEMLQPEEMLLPKRTSVNRPQLPVQGFKTMEWRFV
jgi:HD-like signal output (HDOD) protein